ncbi:MAG TPA: hypothetical protein VG937_16075 [Polyangiaceae bacterium]|nr:hypothetical protein [Polyangiaceae bacterium]
MAHEQVRLDHSLTLLTSSSASSPISLQLSETEKGAALDCDEHVFRDWVWGKEEDDLLRQFSESMLPDRIETLVQFGVGAGRLAVDVHRSRRPASTYALDWNPLPLWAAAQLLRGETLGRS